MFPSKSKELSEYHSVPPYSQDHQHIRDLNQVDPPMSRGFTQLLRYGCGQLRRFTQDRACFALVKRNTTHNTLASIGKVHATATSHRWTTETQGLWTQSSKMHVTCSSKSSSLCEKHVGFWPSGGRVSTYSILLTSISQPLVCYDVFCPRYFKGTRHPNRILPIHTCCST